jgi:hypothetical protein
VVADQCTVAYGYAEDLSRGSYDITDNGDGTSAVTNICAGSALTPLGVSKRKADRVTMDTGLSGVEFANLARIIDRMSRGSVAAGARGAFAKPAERIMERMSRGSIAVSASERGADRGESLRRG